jgi:DNA-binding MarR family transcriptional regulator
MSSSRAHAGAKPDLFISRALWQAQHAIEQAFDALLGPLGLSTTLAGTLTFLAEAPGSSTADLARRAGVTAQSMAYATGRLEELGLIVRTPHPVHGRIMQLDFTPSGRQALDRASAVITRAEDQLIHDLSNTARQDLLDHLAAFQERAEHLVHIAATSSD